MREDPPGPCGKSRCVWQEGWYEDGLRGYVCDESENDVTYKRCPHGHGEAVEMRQRGSLHRAKIVTRHITAMGSWTSGAGRIYEVDYENSCFNGRGRLSCRTDSETREGQWAMGWLHGPVTVVRDGVHTAHDHVFDTGRRCGTFK